MDVSAYLEAEERGITLPTEVLDRELDDAEAGGGAGMKLRGIWKRLSSTTRGGTRDMNATRKTPVRIPRRRLANARLNMVAAWKSGVNLQLLRDTYDFSNGTTVAAHIWAYHRTVEPLFAREPVLTGPSQRRERLPNLYAHALAKFGAPPKAEPAPVEAPPTHVETIEVDPLEATLARIISMSTAITGVLREVSTELQTRRATTATRDRDALFDMMSDFFSKNGR